MLFRPHLAGLCARVPAPTCLRGKYDRRKHNLFSAKSLKRLEAREARGKQREPKPVAPPEVLFSFSPTGNVGASDVTPITGQDAGYVLERGVYESHSRHSAKEVQLALRRAMARFPDAKCSPRYLRFAQREL